MEQTLSADDDPLRSQNPLEITLEEFADRVSECRNAGKEQSYRGAAARLYRCLRTYLPRHYPQIKTLADFDTFRKAGLAASLGRIPSIGEKTCDELNSFLNEYGVPPLPWEIPRTPPAQTPKPIITLETEIYSFISMARRPKAPHQLGAGAAAALSRYAEAHPEHTRIGDVVRALDREGLSTLASYAKGMRFTKQSGASVNHTLAAYGLPIIRW